MRHDSCSVEIRMRMVILVAAILVGLGGVTAAQVGMADTQSQSVGPTMGASAADLDRARNLAAQAQKRLQPPRTKGSRWRQPRDGWDKAPAPR